MRRATYWLLKMRTQADPGRAKDKESVYIVLTGPGIAITGKMLTNWPAADTDAQMK